MDHQSDHERVVDAWLSRHAAGLTGEQTRRLLERALAAVWARTRTTLGDVTLTAVIDRVVFTAGERFAVLNGLHVREDGRVGEAPSGPDLADTWVPGMRFVLVEFLTVIGNLTADILTPQLHAALDDVVRDAPSKDEP